jgi:hypothetical protein
VEGLAEVLYRAQFPERDAAPISDWAKGELTKLATAALAYLGDEAAKLRAERDALRAGYTCVACYANHDSQLKHELDEARTSYVKAARERDAATARAEKAEASQAEAERHAASESLLRIHAEQAIAEQAATIERLTAANAALAADAVRAMDERKAAPPETPATCPKCHHPEHNSGACQVKHPPYGVEADMCLGEQVRCDCPATAHPGPDASVQQPASPPASAPALSQMERWLNEMCLSGQINTGHVAFAMGHARDDLAELREKLEDELCRQVDGVRSALGVDGNSSRPLACYAEDAVKRIAGLEAELADATKRAEANSQAARDLARLRQMAADKVGFKILCAGTAPDVAEWERLLAGEPG